MITERDLLYIERLAGLGRAVERGIVSLTQTPNCCVIHPDDWPSVAASFLAEGFVVVEYTENQRWFHLESWDSVMDVCLSDWQRRGEAWTWHSSLVGRRYA